MPAALCLLGALISFVLVAIVLWAVWWGVTQILAAFGIALPGQIVVLLKVLVVLVVVFIIVQMIYTGAYCGFLPWWPGARRV